MSAYRDLNTNPPEDRPYTFFLVRPKGLHSRFQEPFVPCVAQRMGDELFSCDNEIEALTWVKGDPNDLESYVQNGPTTNIFEANLEWCPLPE